MTNSEQEFFDDSIKNYYLKNLKPKEDEFEEYRLDALSHQQSRQKLLKVTIISSILIVILTAYISPGIIILPIILAIVLIAFIDHWSDAPGKKFSRIDPKIQIFPTLFKIFGEKFHYSHDVDINLKDLDKKAKIIPRYDNYSLEDHVIGHFDDLNFEIFEAQLIQNSGSGMQQRSMTVFKGPIISIEMNKNFTSKTVIRSNSLTSKLFSSYERLTLEDPIFEKEFDVYTTDQIEGRYLLTTSFMERLLHLSEFFDSQIECSFFDNKLLIMANAPQRNLFESSSASIHSPINLAQDLNNIITEMGLIKEIVTILKLDEKTGI